MKVPFHYQPRSYQAEFLSGMRDKRFGVLMWARRAGKGLSTFVYAIQRMVEEPMGVVIVYPTKEQGYNAFWNNVENDGFRTIEHIPKELILSQTNTKDNMSMTLKNGSTLTLVGANANPEALRGNNTKLYILSEFVDIVSGVLGIIRPIVAANDGQIIIESTPKQDGVSGGTFIKLLEAAEKDPTQYAQRVYATQYMSAEQLEQTRQDYITEYGNDFLYRQEFLLDEGQALMTSYYGNEISRKIKNGEIGIHPHDSNLPVYTSWDLGGGGDGTAGLFWQYYNKKLNIIDAYETAVIDDKLLVDYIRSKPYNYRWHFFPHDGAVRDSDGIQRLVKLQGLGLANSSLLKRKKKEDGIRESVHLMSSADTTWHKPFTTGAIEKLRLYKRKYNKYTGDYEGPEHDSSSHFSDSFRYCSDATKQYFDAKGEFLIRTDQKVEEYEDEVVANIYGGDDWDF